MNRDDIIRMAREAGGADITSHGWTSWVGTHSTEFLERFAALVAAIDREKVAAWMRSKSYATGHGDTIEDLLKELEWQVAEREREACAKLCEEKASRIEREAANADDDSDIGSVISLWTSGCAINCAAAIRARGET